MELRQFEKCEMSVIWKVNISKHFSNAFYYI
nr:MAG TPA: hypothetical protein [Caudoviricetes sp.]